MRRNVKKNTGEKARETAEKQRPKGDRKMDQSPRSPATLGLWSHFGRHFSAIFRAFLLLFSHIFFLTFLLIYWLDSSEENLSKSRANQSTKFPIFGKAKDFVADFPLRIETRSNDVGMT